MAVTKMKLVRWSGRPPELAELAAYETEFREGYDKLELDLKEKGPLDMLEMQAGLKALDDILNAKYKLIIEVPYPRTKKAMTALIDQFGAPILAARAQDGTNEPILVIFDKQFGE